MRRECTHTKTTVIPGHGSMGMPATVKDVSSTGLRLTIESGLESGSFARVPLDRIVVEGVIRYCEPNADGTYEAGLQIMTTR